MSLSRSFMSLSGGKVATYAVLITAIVALLIPIALIEINVLRHTQGTVTYPRDNTFINMTVGRNLAFNEVWGISKYSFQSAATSPLYAILLAAVYFIAGAHLVIPLIINLLAAIFLLFDTQRWLILNRLSAPGQLLILLLVIFCTPLPLMVVSGTEHTLQLLFCFLFLRSFIQAAAMASLPIRQSSAPAEATPSRQSAPLSRWVYIFAGWMVLSGYQCGIIALAACGWLCWRRQWLPALKLAAVAFLPILLFGVLSISKGGYFLPNPLLLDGAAAPYSEAFLLGNMIVFAGVLLAYYGKRIKSERPAIIRWSLIGLPALLALCWCLRTVTGYMTIGQNCIDLYYQQYQTARFVHRYYNRFGIACNDPGVISYWSEGRKLDLTGVADHSVMRSRRANSWSSAIADSLSRKENIRIAILSDAAYSSILPQRWNKVASWKTSNNSRTGFDSVSFYVPDTFSITSLRKNLEAYQPLLPPAIIVRYY